MYQLLCGDLKAFRKPGIMMVQWNGNCIGHQETLDLKTLAVTKSFCDLENV